MKNVSSQKKTPNLVSEFYKNHKVIVSYLHLFYEISFINCS